MRVVLVGRWVYARNRSTGAITRLWPDQFPVGGKPENIRLVGTFCEFLSELRDLHDALTAAGVTSAMRDAARLMDHGDEPSIFLSTTPAVVVLDGGEVCKVYRVDDASDLDPANFSAAQFQQDVADYQAAKAAQAQADADAAQEDTTQKDTARTILAKIEDDTITTEELKQALGVLIKRELRRSRKE